MEIEQAKHPGEAAPMSEQMRVERSRLGVLLSLAVIAVALAGAVALLIPGVQEDLPVVGGLDYRVLQAGLFLLVVAFSLYTYERERNFRRLSEDLVQQRIEAAEMIARLSFLEEVQTERDMVAALLLASADGILAVDGDRRAVRLNPAFEELTGVPSEGAVGARCEQLFGCRRADGLACGQVCPFERVLGGETVRGHSFPARRRDGSEAWLAGSFAPVRDLDGSVVSGIGSLRDITQIKEVEHLQQDFVSIVSHELRGPLTAIKGFVTTLLRSRDRISPDTRTEFLETINKQADRLNQLVEDLLSVSRIESRRLHLKMARVDLESLAAKVVDQFRAQWGDRAIVIEADPGMPLVVADESRVDEVLVNLIDNAVKYSPDGGAVRVSISSTEDAAVVAVGDEGIGIAPEDAARLFEKFHRVATDETRDIGGTGLGLYIVRRIIEAHGGSVYVTSAPGAGSTFTVELPLAGPEPGAR